ncbi:DUF7677 family protein [Streptomyces lushanensis]|uniref:DUF7677 family protein n=1 Tax=Streptomyces lushanensis TaxID=1434255 RepID=UPI003CCBC620
MGHLPVDVRASLRFFAFYLANGTIDVDLLEGFDYRPALFEFGSSLEQVFAIYGNVLEVDANGNVLNDEDAQHRAAQWIRRCCDPSYQVEPPFQAWETELGVPARCVVRGSHGRRPLADHRGCRAGPAPGPAERRGRAPGAGLRTARHTKGHGRGGSVRPLVRWLT